MASAACRTGGWAVVAATCWIGLGDYLIAATALTEGLELATLNVRHYPMFPGLARPFPT
jgi:predicted nucleic acid-binding protein